MKLCFWQETLRQRGILAGYFVQVRVISRVFRKLRQVKPVDEFWLYGGILYFWRTMLCRISLQENPLGNLRFSIPIENKARAAHGIVAGYFCRPAAQMRGAITPGGT